MRWRKVFRGEERQLGAMRRWLASLLPAVPARDDVILVATELASNAICHTASGRGGWLTVEITWWRSAVRVGVTDCGGPGQPQVVDDPAGERGRGLLLRRRGRYAQDGPGARPARRTRAPDSFRSAPKKQ